MPPSLTLRRIVADRLFDGQWLQRGPVVLELAGDHIGRIEKVSAGEAEEAMRSGGPDALDCRGRTVLPGLVNCHVHVGRQGFFAPIEPLAPRQVARNLTDALAAGVTTLGEMGCTAPLSRALRDLTAADPACGPALWCTGPMLTVPAGYPLDWMPRAFAWLGAALPCATPDQGRAAVRRVVADGMDYVKLSVMHRSYADQPLPAMTRPIARAIVEEAARLGRRVLAHAHSLEDYRVALDAGVHALMHAAFEPLDDELVKRIRDAGLPVCSTLWVFDSVCPGAEARWHEDPRYRDTVPAALLADWRRFSDAYQRSGAQLPPGIAGGLEKDRAREGARIAIENMGRLAQAGVPVAMGTDAAYGFALLGRPGDELRCLVRAGLDQRACLEASTATSAALLGLGDRGVLAPGRRADLVVVDDDPVVDLAALERIHRVIRSGRAFRPADLGRRPALGAKGTAAVLRGMVTSVWAARRAWSQP